MKTFIAACLLVACVSCALAAPDERETPEQYPGQLARMRVAMLYPAFVSESPVPRTATPEGRLEGFASDADRVARNVDGLCVYLRAGLKTPDAVAGDPERWDAAWKRLDMEVIRLSELIAEGEALERLPASARPSRRGGRGYVRLEDAPEFPGEEGARLHRAVVLEAYARNLREHLLRRGVEDMASR